jgi:predicted PurR-regulated permease PerM
VVSIVVLSALALYLIYLLRQPIGWLVLATFVAVCASGPVNVLSRRMRRGFAITIVYLGIILVPIGIGAILIPPVVTAIVDTARRLPEYARDVEEAFQENERLQELNQDFDITTKLQERAQDLAGSIDDAAGVVADIGAGLVSGIFAVVTILVLSMFMVGRGRQWVDAALRTRPPHQAHALRRALDHMSEAVANYVAGALLQATVAGFSAFIVLTILDVPSPLALAVVMALLDLIPLVGATIGAVIVGVVTVFADFPLDTIIWAIFAIAYQQFENYVVQPRIQSRAVALDPFIVVVAALIGSALLGVLGALLAIPAAAVVQIAVREYLGYRRARLAEAQGLTGPDGEPPGGGPPPPPPEPKPDAPPAPA